MSTYVVVSKLNGESDLVNGSALPKEYFSTIDLYYQLLYSLNDLQNIRCNLREQLGGLSEVSID